MVVAAAAADGGGTASVEVVAAVVMVMVMIRWCQRWWRRESERYSWERYGLNNPRSNNENNGSINPHTDPS